MPCVSCSYCEYLGQGETVKAKWEDALKHEMICPERKTQDAPVCDCEIE